MPKETSYECFALVKGYRQKACDWKKEEVLRASEFRNCMESTSVWPLLRGAMGDREEGLRLAQRAYENEPSPSHAMQFGIALLWLGKYSEAWKHFRSVIETSKTAGDADYGMAGVAKWCLNKPEEAVLEWRAGVSAKYARSSGLNIRMPLLLFFAAVYDHSDVDTKLVEKLLREKASDKRIRNWPGPIALLILDQINQTDFQNCCLGIRPNDTGKNPFARYPPEDAANCLWLANFYKKVLELNQTRNFSVFKSFMKAHSDTSQPEWQDERNVFISRIWYEEFFLARHAAES